MIQVCWSTCQTIVRRWGEKAKKVPVWAWLLGIPLCGLFYYSGGHALSGGAVSLGQNDQQEGRFQKIAQAHDAVQVDAVTLFQAFKNNEVKAEQDYGGKVVEVTGILEAVKELYIEMAEANTGFVLGLIHAYPDEQSKSKFASLMKGSQVRLRGVCIGNEFASVTIKNAMLLD